LELKLDATTTFDWQRASQGSSCRGAPLQRVVGIHWPPSKSFRKSTYGYQTQEGRTLIRTTNL